MKRSERTFVRHLFGAKVTKEHKREQLENKQDLSAGNHSLRLPALRPCLLRHSKIVVLSTILGVFCGPFLVNLLLGKTNVSAASLTLSIPDSISVSINTQDGVTYKESDKSNITIKTDAYAGYTLNIKSTDGTNVLRTTDGKAINSIESPLDDYQASGATNTWAFLPGKLNSVENNTYQPGPKADLLLGRSSGSNSEPEVYPISIATKIDGNQPTGTYKNSFTITATANPVPYEITYDYNNGSGSISPNPQTGTGIEGSTIKLSEEVPQRENYEFLGWCDTPTDNEECNGNKYEKGASYILKNNDNKFVLYSIWKPFGFEEAFNAFGKQKQDGYYKMQDMTPEICNAVIISSEESSTTLIDIRDNNNYTIAKLADDKCWMTQNLRLGDSKLQNRNLTSEDTDITNVFTLPYSDCAMASYPDNAGSGALRYCNSDNTTYGNYYNWYVATAQSGTVSQSSGDAPYSICPKGWSLPKKTDIDTLITKYDAITAFQPPANFVYPGYCTSYNNLGCPARQGTRGSYWLSTVANSDQPYNLHAFDNFFGLNLWSKSYGFAVRCISRR